MCRFLKLCQNRHHNEIIILENNWLWMRDFSSLPFPHSFLKNPAWYFFFPEMIPVSLYLYKIVITQNYSINWMMWFKCCICGLLSPFSLPLMRKRILCLRDYTIRIMSLMWSSNNWHLQFYQTRIKLEWWSKCNVEKWDRKQKLNWFFPPQVFL